MYEDEKFDDVLAPMRPDNLHDGYGFVIEVGDGRVYKIPFHTLDDPGYFMVDLKVDDVHFTLEISRIGRHARAGYFQVAMNYYTEPQRHGELIFNLADIDIFRTTRAPYLSASVINEMVNALKEYLHTGLYRDHEEHYARLPDINLVTAEVGAKYLVQDTRGLEALNPPEEPEEDQEVTEIDSAWDLF